MYDLLQVVRRDEKARMLYEARRAEISYQFTRIKSAEEKGMNIGRIKVAENFLKMGLTIEQVVKGSELSMEKVIETKKNM